MKILYFTATGNNLYVAKRIGGELYSIPQLLKEVKYECKDEKIGIVFPIYHLTVPFYIEEFLHKVSLHADYIFAIMSYGMMKGTAENDLLKIAEECGIDFSYVNTIKMVDNWLPVFSMDKQIENESKKEIEKQLETIIADIKSSKNYKPKSTIVNQLITKGRSIIEPRKIGGKGITRKFFVEDTCTNCGICTKVCPLNNIQLTESKPFFSNNCHSCLACTQNCPQNAIRLKGEKSTTRFRNQHITLREIIELNQ